MTNILEIKMARRAEDFLQIPPNTLALITKYQKSIKDIQMAYQNAMQDGVEQLPEAKVRDLNQKFAPLKKAYEENIKLMGEVEAILELENPQRTIKLMELAQRPLSQELKNIVPEVLKNLKNKPLVEKIGAEFKNIKEQVEMLDSLINGARGDRPRRK